MIATKGTVKLWLVASS